MQYFIDFVSIDLKLMENNQSCFALSVISFSYNYELLEIKMKCPLFYLRESARYEYLMHYHDNILMVIFN